MFKKNTEFTFHTKQSIICIINCPLKKYIYTTLNLYIHPAETHRLLKFLFHIMGRLVPAHNNRTSYQMTQVFTESKMSLFFLCLIDHCFCVTQVTGTVVKGSKVAHTQPDCSQYDLTEENVTTPAPSQGCHLPTLLV